MPSRLVNRLNSARQRQFVGRTSELALFQSALTAPELPFFVLYIFGPGGVGKTTLLKECVSLCAQTQAPVFFLDARNIEPTPEAFVGALQRTMGLAPPDTPLQALAANPYRQVILIDTYEILMAIDGWLRDVFLPQMPENVLVVLAGREPPSLAWRTDPGWQPLMRTISLQNLNMAESQAYLVNHMIPADQHQAVLDFTHGHPLALSLIADVFAQRSEARFQPEAAPDIIKTLLEQFVQQVPSPAHRAALEVCGLVRLTNEALLSAMLTMPDVHELFGWLRNLSFIESGQQGLFPHDLVREALDADLRWRNPDWYAELHRRARVYYSNGLLRAPMPEQQRILADYIFLHRKNPVVRPFFEWQASGGMLTSPLQASDKPMLLAMVATHEGLESVRLAEHWLDQQPEGVLVVRDPDGQPSGFLTIVALHHAKPEDLRADAAAHAAWRYLEHTAPLRAGEGATFFRFWMARDTYQEVSPAQSLIFINIVRHYLTTPGLAFSFVPCAEPDFWAPMLTYADLTRIPEVDFVVGQRLYGVYGHDWRAVPPIDWLTLLAEKELSTEPNATVASPPSTTLVVLSQETFAAAVRDALQDFVRPDKLQTNPLLKSRLVLEPAAPTAGVAERVTTLRTVLQSACESLQASPRDIKCYRALYHTYLSPAPTQEKAAELLDLPFSTFRRHLKAGITRVTEILWQQELQGSPN